MKKVLTLLLMSLLLLHARSQTCEQREKVQVSTIGSFSAAFLYNTYGMIGSLADGFGHDAYDEETMTGLLNAQTKLLDNMTQVMEKLFLGNNLQDSVDANYARNTATLLQGLKKQVQHLQEYVNSKSKQKLDAFHVQQDKNWKAISKLMGIKD